MKASLASSIPAGRLADPDEIAKAADFLASNDSSFVFGAHIAVDGGHAQITRYSSVGLVPTNALVIMNEPNSWMVGHPEVIVANGAPSYHRRLPWGCGHALRTALTDRICHSHPRLTVGALESSPIVEPGAMVHDR